MDSVPRRALASLRAWLLHPEVLVGLMALFVRLLVVRSGLYFIWDQGRDAAAMERILRGDLTLIGPTSGIQGLFLGPLWFYLGLPGYVLGGGNPYVLITWFILVGATTIPLSWLFARQLFRDSSWRWTCYLLLLFLPGSIHGGIFPWNPLLAPPLLLVSILALSRARRSRWWLFLGFLSFSLMLQSEFAYAVFYLPVLFVLLPWFRSDLGATYQAWRSTRSDLVKKHLKNIAPRSDLLVALTALGITLAPQILFELRHNFLMTKAVVAQVLAPTNQVSWQTLWQRRPEQLWTGLAITLFGAVGERTILMVAALILILWGIRAVWRRHRTPAWLLTALFFVLPLPFFALWRGNHGNFFAYYLTAHYVVMVPLLVLGAQTLPRHLAAHARPFLLGALTIMAVAYIWNNIVAPNNQAGLNTMRHALGQLYGWRAHDTTDRATFRIFTPNLQTEHYDHLLGWLARVYDTQAPLTVRQPNDAVWYILIEPDRELPFTRFADWYRDATQGGIKVRQECVGVLWLETWVTPAFASQSGLLTVTAPRLPCAAWFTNGDTAR